VQAPLATLLIVGAAVLPLMIAAAVPAGDFPQAANMTANKARLMTSFTRFGFMNMIS
jgi:hypothetical protein